MVRGDRDTRGPSKGAGQPRTLAEVLESVLADSQLDLAAPIAAIGQSWVSIVGVEVASHCKPAGIKGDVLHVDVDSSVWCQQLQLRSPEILHALERFLGAAAPTGLRFRVGYSRPPDSDNRDNDDENR